MCDTDWLEDAGAFIEDERSIDHNDADLLNDEPTPLDEEN